MIGDFSLVSCPVTSDFQTGDCLTSEEKAWLGERASRKRMADFIAGRAAAKMAVRSCLSIPEEVPVSIMRTKDGDQAGKPYAVMGNDRRLLPVHVSITHADQKAYAVASRFVVGIDNVTIEAYGSAFIQEVFQADELEGWANWLGVHPENPLAVCAGFAAKEAFLKCIGVGLRYSLRKIHITPIRGSKPQEPGAFFHRYIRACCNIRDESGLEANHVQSVMLSGCFAIRDRQVIILFIDEDSRINSGFQNRVDRKSYCVQKVL